MTYLELKIALDIGDPKTILSNVVDPYYDNDDRYNGHYFVVCDDGNVHCFNENGIEQRIDYIPNFCFIQNLSLEKIVIPENVTSIGESAFDGCDCLTSVMIPNSVTSIKDYVFWECYSLKNVTIPNSVISIGCNAFFSCTSLESVVFKGKTMEEVEAMDHYPWDIPIDDAIYCM